ncbi:MAG: heterodisulfide reductase subunit D [Flavobacteriales bacterium]|jgi:heterodisulfide reductase subunit D|tara:strand:+ start:937 stop:1716 length:780 start_codon:yes stop_codon:yes gene_type:complete
MIVPTMAEMMAQGKQPEVLFWVGSAGSFDDRAKKITRAFVKVLHAAKVNFAVLGTEESSTGDAAKRVGNEFLFQMQAITNIEIMNAYEVKNIVTCDPHSFNTLKNEYPGLGGKYNVTHHTQFIKKLIKDGRLKIDGKKYEQSRITFHDPCYLGRANDEFDAPRELIQQLNSQFMEMHRNKENALCCGAGGAQMFKEPEKGNMDINVLRTQDALKTNPDIIVTACPYCNTMMTDGLKAANKENSVAVFDIVELIANTQEL